MRKLRNDPHRRGVDTASPFPPVTHYDPVSAEGRRLVAIGRLDERRVVEVRTAAHGVLAVGLTPDGSPFAVSNCAGTSSRSWGEGVSTTRAASNVPGTGLITT